MSQPITVRRKLSINGSSELITDGSGEVLYLVSRSRNQYLQFRELLFGSAMDCRFIIGIFFGGNYQISKILFVSPNQYHIRFSYGSGEWRNGADPWLHAVVPEPSSHPPRTEGIGMIDVLCCRHTEEATEIASDAEGRWFSFNVDMNSILLMERKGMPVHLQGLPCVECACDLSTIIHELEDAGEVKGSKPVYVLEKQQV